ncbi:MAG: undecaprenyl-diphosphate phosphatase [Saprospiraceae bacterium]|nr:undecaprenyl-diphosphate phosphatase [Saprospiraceae bacterium]
MSEYLITLILGIVQGITEFLPISSDGHLEIAKYLLGDKSQGMDSLSLTIVLHIATTLSICYVLREKIVSILNGLFRFDRSTLSLAGLIIVSMIPAAIAGLFFEKEISSFFNGNINFVASMLFLNGLFLYIGNRAKPSNENITWIKAFLMGIAQMVAILPGISRSGTTISTAALLNINRAVAAEFSFIMVLPLIFGKILKDIIFDQGFTQLQYSGGAIAVGFVAAFIVGILAFKLLLRLVENMKMNYFAFYCIAIAFIIFAISKI